MRLKNWKIVCDLYLFFDAQKLLKLLVIVQTLIHLCEIPVITLSITVKTVDLISFTMVVCI